MQSKPIKEVLIDIEKAIGNTRDAIANATAQQSLIQNEYAQAKQEAHNSHKQALEAVLEGDQALAMQALSSEALQEKVVNILQPQIKQQEAVTDLLKNNLKALIEVKTAVEKWNELKSQCLSLEEKVKIVISEQLSIDLENINLNSSLFLGYYLHFSSFSSISSGSSQYDCPANSLGVDTLNAIELLMAIEEEFDVEIPEEEQGKTITVKELVDLISSRLS